MESSNNFEITVHYPDGIDGYAHINLALYCQGLVKNGIVAIIEHGERKVRGHIPGELVYLHAPQGASLRVRLAHQPGKPGPSPDDVAQIVREMQETVTPRERGGPQDLEARHMRM